MDKSKLKKFALMGMAGGLMLSNPNPVEANITQDSGSIVAAGCGGSKAGCGGARSSKRPYIAAEDQQTNQPTQKNVKPISENELLSKLDAEGKSTYKNLSPEGKALALRMAGEFCNGRDTCGGYKDYNEVVKAAAKKMGEKRGMMNRPANQPSSSNY